MAKSTCTHCGEVFKSVAGFDKHRAGSYGEAVYAPDDLKRKRPVGQAPATRHCLPLEEMEALGMSKNAQGWWITSAYEASAHEDDD